MSLEKVQLNHQIYNVVVLDNEWMCNVHTDTILEFYSMNAHYEYHACPKCGNYIEVD